jgi:hypothetical protein
MTDGTLRFETQELKYPMEKARNSEIRKLPNLIT